VRRLRPTALALLVLVGGWLAAGLVTAGPASAHASLVSSTPADGDRLDSSPDRISLQFSEHISLGPGYARVLDAGGARVDSGSPSVSGDVVTIPLRAQLGRGAYVVTYRIISADSHPVAGAYSFAVGGAALVSAQSVAAQTPTNSGVAFLLPLFRWIGYAGLALAVGLPVFLLVCWPSGWTSARLRRLTLWGAAAVTVGALAGYLLQGPYAAGSGLGSLLEGSLLSATAQSGAGVLLLVRAVLGLALLGLLATVWRRGEPPDQWRTAVGIVLALGLVGTTAGIGHAVAGSATGLAFLSTFVHVASMTVWLGGLTGLLAGALRTGVPLAEITGALPRFSRLAFGAVSALVVTGVLQAVREVSTPAALFTTEYGWILTAKLIVIVVVLGAAGVSRVWVQQHLGGGRRPDGRRRVTAQAFAAEPGSAGSAAVGVADAGGAGAGLPDRVQREATAALPSLRRSVLVELALAAAILALSGVLVGEAPASASAAPQPIDRVLVLRGNSGNEGSVEVSVAPASPGTNSVHVFLFDASGAPAQPAGIQVTLTDQARSIGPLDVKLQPAGPGHYTADAMSIPGAGSWTLAVIVRLDEFTAVTASTTFPVR
jgi:copper transport protein